MPRRPKLFALPASHPCATVEEALRLKGIAYDRIDLPPVMHAPVHKVLFGARTAPGIVLADGRRLSGSRSILRELDRIVPEPPLRPADARERAEVEAAEQWGDEVFQPIPRRLAWAIFRREPAAMLSYDDGRLPLPKVVVRGAAPAVIAVAARVNRATGEQVAADLAALPGHLDRVDALLAEGVLGGEQPNCADLQIAAGVRILLTFGDTAPLVQGRPCDAWSRRLFPHYAGEAPAVLA